MTLLCDGRDVQVSEDQAFLKDRSDFMVSSQPDEDVGVPEDC